MARRAVKETAHERREREARWEANEARIAGQRALFVALPASDATEALKAAMMDRAWMLIDSGCCEEADAILEFLPEPDIVRLLDEYFESAAG